MKVLSILLLALFASSASAVGFVNGNGNGNGNGNDQDIPVEAAGGAIPDEFLVMHDGDVKPRGLLNGLMKSGRAEILHEYTIINCFAVRMKLNALQNALKNIEGVSIYPNDVVTAIAVQSPATWGIDRVDQITGTNNQYEYERDGNNVDVYILDTGITIEHRDFGGRASHGADFTGEGNYDGHGHGSHVAGTLSPIIIVYIYISLSLLPYALFVPCDFNIQMSHLFHVGACDSILIFRNCWGHNIWDRQEGQFDCSQGFEFIGLWILGWNYCCDRLGCRTTTTEWSRHQHESWWGS
jgi:subtilisin family serine protease